MAFIFKKKEQKKSVQSYFDTEIFKLLNNFKSNEHKPNKKDTNKRMSRIACAFANFNLTQNFLILQTKN